MNHVNVQKHTKSTNSYRNLFTRASQNTATNYLNSVNNFIGASEINLPWTIVIPAKMWWEIPDKLHESHQELVCT